MKRNILFALALLLLATIPSCQSSDPKKTKPKPVPPGMGEDISGLSWNRPRSWEGGAGFGGMMPQSR